MSSNYRDRDCGTGQAGANMRSHVVGTFERVPVMARFFGNQAFEEIPQIVGNVGICIFLNHKRTGSVLHKQRQCAAQNRLITKPFVNSGSERVQPFAFGADGERGV